MNTFLALKQAAEYLGASENQLRYWNEKRLIPYSKPAGKLIFYKKSDLDKFMENNTVHSVSQLEEQATSKINSIRKRKTA